MFFRRFLIRSFKFCLGVLFVSLFFLPRYEGVKRPVPVIEYGLFLVSGRPPQTKPVYWKREPGLYEVVLCSVVSFMLAVGVICPLFGYLASVNAWGNYITVDAPNMKDYAEWQARKAGILATLQEQERNGELRFPPWKEFNYSDQRPFYVHTFYAYQVYKDPERRARQKHLAESLKRV